MLSGALCLFWVSGFLESWELYDKSFVFVAGFLFHLHPKRYDFIMRPVEENGLGYKVVIDYINAHSKANIRY